MTTRSAPGEAPRAPTVLASLTNGSPWTRHLQGKVPQATPGFWITTLLSTTLGATAADSLSRDLELGPSATTAIISLCLLGTLIGQLATRRYHPGSYWPSVVLCSAVAALLADTFGGEPGLGLPTLTALFAVALAATLFGWHRAEHTVAVRSVFTRRREACYWVAVVCACTLGSAAQDQTSRSLGLGRAAVVLPFAAVLLLVALAAGVHKLPAVAAFWAAYVVIPPIGAAIGDLLTAPSHLRGLGLPPDATSVGLAVAVLLAVSVSSAGMHRPRRSPHAPA